MSSTNSQIYAQHVLASGAVDPSWPTAGRAVCTAANRRGYPEAVADGNGGAITAFDPGTGNVLWSRQTEGAVLGSPAYVNGMIGLVQGSTFEVVNAANGQLLYSYVLPAPVYGAVSVARSQFYVGAVNKNLYAFGLPGSTTTPPADPNCPAGFTCQDIRSPAIAGSESTSNGVLTVTASGAAIHGTSDQFRFISKPVTGNSD